MSDMTIDRIVNKHWQGWPSPERARADLEKLVEAVRNATPAEPSAPDPKP